MRKEYNRECVTKGHKDRLVDNGAAGHGAVCIRCGRRYSIRRYKTNLQAAKGEK